MTQHRITGLSEVARLCGVSLSTVNRKVPKLRDYGAEKDAEGVWHVPVTAIEAVGWKLQAEPADMPRHATSDMPATRTDMSPDMDAFREENAALRERAIRAEAEAGKWQAIAAERLQNLDDLRRSHRLLEARNHPSETQPEPMSSETVEPAQVSEPHSRPSRFSRWLAR